MNLSTKFNYSKGNRKLSQNSFSSGEMQAIAFNFEERKQLTQQNQSESAHCRLELKVYSTLKQVTTTLEFSKNKKTPELKRL